MATTKLDHSEALFQRDRPNLPRAMSMREAVPTPSAQLPDLGQQQFLASTEGSRACSAALPRPHGTGVF
jgi:hypothetical protein